LALHQARDLFGREEAALRLPEVDRGESAHRGSRRLGGLSAHFSRPPCVGGLVPARRASAANALDGRPYAHRRGIASCAATIAGSPSPTALLESTMPIPTAAWPALALVAGLLLPTQAAQKFAPPVAA